MTDTKRGNILKEITIKNNILNLKYLRLARFYKYENDRRYDIVLDVTTEYPKHL